jgi:hypothetical protein
MIAEDAIKIFNSSNEEEIKRQMRLAEKEVRDSVSSSFI